MLAKQSAEETVSSVVRSDGINIHWHDGIELVPGKQKRIKSVMVTNSDYKTDKWTFLMAHEFFDALAVHCFEVPQALILSLLQEFNVSNTFLITENRRRLARAAC